MESRATFHFICFMIRNAQIDNEFGHITVYSVNNNSSMNINVYNSNIFHVYIDNAMYALQVLLFKL